MNRWLDAASPVVLPISEEHFSWERGRVRSPAGLSRQFAETGWPRWDRARRLLPRT
ncbi:MAG: hypothetical protein AVDCRST_MAG70-71 [uncultured Thermomicrobiales bacterium]|uniref:Uncharacterized protein n=1 Tax=uncultured Thermomicrobiales bacterium TaxID=1645740 RepID=A0A6J4U7Z5_9BACT|nr:MAG: hypothetical protein AVDCRST_MAG70-71 [uncultured Thermomicrobiales bacterium]